MYYYYDVREILQLLMSGSLFVTGLIAIVAGLLTLVARDYRRAVRELSGHTADVGPKAMLDVNLAAALEASAALVDAVNRLVRTAVGVGAFLCLTGATLCIISFAMLASMGV